MARSSPQFALKGRNFAAIAGMSAKNVDLYVRAAAELGPQNSPLGKSRHNRRMSAVRSFTRAPIPVRAPTNALEEPATLLFKCN